MSRTRAASGVAAILLAAGGSRRLGHPKQLADWQGEPLIRRVVRILLDSRARPCLVVLGARAPEVRAGLRGCAVDLVDNPGWREGMASSIRCGMEAMLTRETQLEAVVICACDQPHLSADHVDRLIARHADTGAPIVASRYAGILGVPALFSRSRFAALRTLRGDRGARDLIRTQEEPVALVDFPLGDRDVDRDTDLPSGR